jgi:uncharacterized protein Smg (DUF494 family)
MIDRYAVQRIMEIIAYVMAERQAGVQLANIDTDVLHRLGYSDSEIAAALSWILEKSEQTVSGDHVAPARSGSFRVLHHIENDLITPEAWGLVLSFHEAGFLSTRDVEELLERAVTMGMEQGIDVADMRNIIAVYVLAERQSLLSGTKMYLDGNETIQ